MTRALLILTVFLFLNARAEEAATAYLEPGRVIKVSAPETGLVLEVLVDEGDKVSSGEELVRLDTRVVEQEAAIASAQAKVLERRLEKLQKLFKKKFASEDEVARAESELEITRLRQKRAEAQMERLTLRTPIDGVVTEVRYDEAESVPGANEHVATVVQLEPMFAQFNLPVAAAAALKEDQRVQLEVAGSETMLEGEVAFISPVAAAVVNTVRVKILVPDAVEKGIPSGSEVRLPLSNLTSETLP